MSDNIHYLKLVMTFRENACQAEADARKATSDDAREVFFAVAETWRNLALSAAREHRRMSRGAERR